MNELNVVWTNQMQGLVLPWLFSQGPTNNNTPRAPDILTAETTQISKIADDILAMRDGSQNEEKKKFPREADDNLYCNG